MNTTFTSYTSSGSLVLRLFVFSFFGLMLASCDDSTDQSVEGLMKRAIEQRDQGKLRASVIDLKTILQKDAKNADARLMLGEIYLGIGDADSAAKELKIAEELGANSTDIHILLGRAHLLRGDYKELLKDYQVNENTNAGVRSKVELLRGLAYLAQRNLDEAEKSFEAASADYKKDINEERPHLKATEPPEFVEAIVGMTNVSIKRKDWDDAQARLDLAISLAPEDADVLSATGELAFKQGKYADSETAFLAAFKKRPNDLQHQIGIARSQIMLKKFDAAIINLEKVLKYFPDHIVTNHYRSLAAVQIKDYGTAKNIAEKILKLQPNYLPAHMISGIANYANGSIEQANASLTRYVAGVPSDANAQRLLGITQIRLSQPSAALATFRPLYDQAPDDSTLLSLVAAAAAARGDLAMAGEYIQKSVDLNPDDRNARLQLSTLKIATGRSDEALKELENAVDKAPGFLKAQYTLMFLHLREKRFDEALLVAKQLQEANPKSENPLIAAGMAYSGKEAWAEALKAFEQALELAPDHIGAAYGIVDIHLRNKDIDKVRTVYARILEKRPGHLRTLMRLVALAQREGRTDDVRTLVVKAMETNPKALEPRLLAAQEQVELNRPAKALAILSEVAGEHTDNPNFLLLTGRAQIAAEKAGEAARTLERLLRLQPNSPATHYLLAQAYTLLGNTARAGSELDQTLALDPKFLRAGVARVRNLAVTKKNDAALQRLNELKAEFPDSRDVAELDAWFALRQDRPEDAVRILKDLDQERASRNSVTLLTVALWRTNDKEGAIASIGDWIKANPTDNQAHVEYANYLTLAERNLEAGKAWKAVVDRMPDNWLALNNLASNLMAENPDKALTYAERAYKVAPDAPPVVMTLTEILLTKNQIDPKRALAIVRPIAKRLPENASVQILLARALGKSGNQDAAVQTLRETLSREKDETLRAKIEQTLKEIQN